MGDPLAAAHELVLDGLAEGIAHTAMIAGNGADQVHESRDVVGSHVQHRPATPCVVEGRIGMPAFVAGAHEEGAAGQGAADRSLVDELAAGLVRSAKECVGRTADAQPSLLGQLQERARLGGRETERLFRMNVFAGGEGF